MFWCFSILRLLDRLRHLVTLNEKLKKQEAEFRESCKVRLYWAASAIIIHLEDFLCKNFEVLESFVLHLILCCVNVFHSFVCRKKWKNSNRALSS